jgi:ATP-binding cassette subfamily B protein RaxB
MTGAVKASPRRRRHLAAALLAMAALSLATPMAAGVRATRAWAQEPVPIAPLYVVLQAGSADCGPALVATLAAWAGRPADLALVTSQAAIGRDGVSLGEFARLASLHGLDGAWYSVRRDRLAGLRTPFVAHLQNGAKGHFVAVVAVGARHAVVADPATGALVGPTDELLRRFSGRVFLLDAPPSPRWEGV